MWLPASEACCCTGYIAFKLPGMLQLLNSIGCRQHQTAPSDDPCFAPCLQLLLVCRTFYKWWSIVILVALSLTQQLVNHAESPPTACGCNPGTQLRSCWVATPRWLGALHRGCPLLIQVTGRTCLCKRALSACALLACPLLCCLCCTAEGSSTPTGCLPLHVRRCSQAPSLLLREWLLCWPCQVSSLYPDSS